MSIFVFLVLVCFLVQSATVREECLELKGPVCIGEVVIPETAREFVQPGLTGSWTFDESIQTQHPMEPPPSTSGPGVLGFGASAFFDKPQSRDAKQHILQNVSLPQQEWSVSLWIFLLPTTSDAFLSILHQGDKLLPRLSLLLWPNIPRLRVKFGDTALDTVSAVTKGHWTQLTIVKSGGVGRVYVNGLLDTQMILGTTPSIRDLKDGLSVGESEWHHGFHGYIDQLKVYSRAITADEARAMASFAFPTLLGGGSLPSLGCHRCSLQRAMSLCGSKVGSHLCSLHELRSYALLVSRLLGWVTLYHTHHAGEPVVEVHVWSHEEGALLHLSSHQSNNNNDNITTPPLSDNIKATTPPNNRVGYGLCCPDH